MFVYLFICEVTTAKVIFRFYKQCSQPQHVLFAKEPFLRKMLLSLFSSNIPLYIEKNPVGKSCKIQETELKTYTPVGSKFVFEKIKFKVLHYIQHDFFRQRQALSNKDQTSIFKSVPIN